MGNEPSTANRWPSSNRPHATPTARLTVMLSLPFDPSTVTAGGQQVRAAGLTTVVEVNRADKSLDTLHVDTRLGSDSIFIAPQVHNLLKFSSA